MQLRTLALVLAVAAPAAVCLTSAHTVRARPPMVPQEMVDACASLSTGEACTFVLGKRTITGKCAQLPDDSLGCRPGGKKKSAPPAKAKK